MSIGFLGRRHQEKWANTSLVLIIAFLYCSSDMFWGRRTSWDLWDYNREPEQIQNSHAECQRD